MKTTGKRKYSLLLIPIFILFFSIVISVILKQYTKQTNNLAQIKLSNLAKESAFLLEQSMQKDFNIMQGVCYALANCNKLPETDLDEYVSNLLHHVLSENSQFLSIWYNAEIPIVDSNANLSYKAFNIGFKYDDFGTIKPFLHHKNFIQTDPNELGTYQNVKNNKQILLLNPVESGLVIDSYAQYKMTYLIPVIQNSNFMGVLGITLSSIVWNDILNSANSDLNNTISYVTPNGIVVCSSNQEKLQTNVFDIYANKKSGSNLKHSIASGESIFFDYKSLESKEQRCVQCYPVMLPANQSYGSLIIDTSAKTLNIGTAKGKTLIILLCILVIILFSLAIVFIIKKIMESIHQANNVLSKVAKGDISSNLKLNIQTGEELQQLSSSVNDLIDRLNNSADFAKNIGQGNLLAEFHNIDDNDVLGKSLLEMRESLLKSKADEEKRKESDLIQNWTIEGQAKFGEILRKSNDNIGQLTFMLLSDLIDYLGAIQGGIFIRDDNEGEDMQFELTGSIAFSRKKKEKSSFKIGEGLIGRCAYEKSTIYMEEVPDDYIYITSGLGEANPRSVLLIPAILNSEVYAIIELVSFNKFLPHQINFVERIGESIASTIANIKINSRTQRLLEQSKQQSEELASQEEEMRQNMEELQATQEEINRLRHDDKMNNERAMEEVNKNRTALLKVLDAMPNKIYLKDAEGRFVFANKKTLESMHLSLDEIVGKSDLDLYDKKETAKYWEEEQKIIKSGKTFTRTYFNVVDGKNVVQETTKTPFYIDFMDQIGLLGFDIDISKLMDKEDQIQDLKDKVKELTKALEGKE